jgi:Tfp pilus assembly protein PilO
MIANLSGRLAALTAAVVVLAVLLVGWFLLLSPQRTKVTSLDNEIADTQSQVASTQAYVSSPATKKSIGELPRLKAILPDDAHMSQVLRQLSVAASSAGVRLDSITPAAPIALGSGQAVPVKLSLEGHYFGLSKFLHLLRAQARTVGTTIKGRGRLYSVSDIQFNSGGANSSSGDGSGAITATVSLNVFVNGASVAAAPGSAPTTTTP